MSGPSHSPYTASTLEAERRPRLRWLWTAGAAVRQAPSSVGTRATERVFAKRIGDQVQGLTHGDESKELYRLDFPAPCAR